jgi:hypothetical protein
MRIVNDSLKLIDYDFRLKIEKIMKIAQREEIVGIDCISVVDEFSHTKCFINSLGCYIPRLNDNKFRIELCLPNILNEKIPEYIFNDYKEIASLFLSEVVFHEVGHHVHHFYRHNIKNGEAFAQKYAEAGYFNYLYTHKKEILKQYRSASLNLIKFDYKSRDKFKLARKELVHWLKNNKDGIDFP